MIGQSSSQSLVFHGGILRNASKILRFAVFFKKTHILLNILIN